MGESSSRMTSNEILAECGVCYLESQVGLYSSRAFVIRYCRHGSSSSCSCECGHCQHRSEGIQAGQSLHSGTWLAPATGMSAWLGMTSHSRTGLVVSCLFGVPRRLYRADWEPAAPSGKCMSGPWGVLEVSSGIGGPSTPIPTLTAGKTHTSKNWPIFPECMWKWGGSTPCGQACLRRPNGTQCAKSHAVWQPPNQGLKNCDISQQNISLRWGVLIFFKTC